MQNHAEEIMEQLNLKEPRDLAIRMAQILNEKKAESVTVLKVDDVTMLTSYFVIASGTSTTHVGALADELEFELAKEAQKPYASEGYDSKNWILLDYGSVITHVFVPNTREYYDLERLWEEGEEVDLTAYLQ